MFPLSSHKGHFQCPLRGMKFQLKLILSLQEEKHTCQAFYKNHWKSWSPGLIQILNACISQWPSWGSSVGFETLTFTLIFTLCQISLWSAFKHFKTLGWSKRRARRLGMGAQRFHGMDNDVYWRGPFQQMVAYFFIKRNSVKEGLDIANFSNIFILVISEFPK